MKALIYLFIGLFSITSWADGHDKAEVSEMNHGEGHAHHGADAASHTNMGTHNKQKGLTFYGDMAVSMSYQGDEELGGAFFGGTGSPGNNLRHANFNGNLIEFNVEKNWGHSHFHFSFGGGQTLADINRDAASGTPSERTLHVTNAYHELKSPYGLSLKTGLFESPMGYESWNPMDNAHFSRSYGFALVPYFHSGISIGYNFKDMVKIDAAVTNGVNVDDLLGDLNDNKHMMIAAEIHPVENLTLEVKYLGGVQPIGGNRISQGTIEATAGYRVNEAFDFAVNYTQLKSIDSPTGDTTSQSIAVYANGKIDKFGLGLRFENFKTDHLAPFGVGTTGFVSSRLIIPALGVPDPNAEMNITSFTLSPSFMVDENAKILLELRYDSSEDELWSDADGAAQDNTFAATLGFMYRW